MSMGLLRITMAAALACLPATTSAEPTEAERLFALKVFPTFQAKCLACHGDKKKLKGDFDMRSREALLRGGESEEPSIVPGKPEESLLVEAIRWQDLEMPPKENDRLDEKQIAAIEEWIRAGAPWPDDETRELVIQSERAVAENDDGVLWRTSGGLGDDWTYRRYKKEDLWSFRPLEQPELPTEDKNPIDAFLDAKREAAGFGPAPMADPLTLVRRAHFDLLGLPPSPAEIETFQTAWAADPEKAWEQLIDRLLASPHYGERQAQHWLDVVRYADTGGYSNDFERSNTWRYRDYVIRSFNADKPYDQFVVEQVAGDELADESVLKRSKEGPVAREKAMRSGNYTEEEVEWLVASTFLRLGAWDNAMTKAPEARQIYLDDVVNAVGQSFLSTTLRCVKCHDHKFDPIPTSDYYRIYAAFAATQIAERPARFLEIENRAGFDEGRTEVEHLLAFAVDRKKEIKNKQETAARKWFDERGLEYLTENERKDLPDEQKPPRHVGLNHVEQGRLKVREQDEWIWKRRLDRYRPMVQSVYNGSDVSFTWNNARKLRLPKNLDRGALPTSAVLLGGALTARGPAVTPGVLSAVGLGISESKSDRYALTNAKYGRRLGLARWIAHPQNGLATRSIVNRLFQQHFVHAIARNPNNFGATGAKPTHPELLDWLTSDFVANGWKIKRVHRLIMRSRAYRQATTHPELEMLREKDPENKLLAVHTPRRLTAEELRDTFLAVTGELVRTRGGVPIRPEINLEVALQPRMIQFSIAPAYQPSPTRAERNRRTITPIEFGGSPTPSSSSSVNPTRTTRAKGVTPRPSRRRP